MKWKTRKSRFSSAASEHRNYCQSLHPGLPPLPTASAGRKVPRCKHTAPEVSAHIGSVYPHTAFPTVPNPEKFRHIPRVPEPAHRRIQYQRSSPARSLLAVPSDISKAAAKYGNPGLHIPAGYRLRLRSSHPSAPFYPALSRDNGMTPPQGSPYGALRRAAAIPQPAWYPGYFLEEFLLFSKTADQIWHYGIFSPPPPPGFPGDTLFPGNPSKKKNNQLIILAFPLLRSAPAEAGPYAHQGLWFPYLQPEPWLL